MGNQLLNIGQQELEFLLKYGSKSNILFGKEIPMLIYHQYGFVKIDLPQLLNEGNIAEIIEIVCNNYEIEKTEIDNLQLISFILWLKGEIEMIGKLEQEHLSSPPDPDMEAAGVRELNELGEINIIDSLAGGDILKWDEIEKLPYHKVFDKLKKNVVENKVNKAYHKIINEKSKKRK